MHKKKPAKSVFLAKSNDYYLHLIENSNEMFYLTNAKQGKFEYVSGASTQICGFTPEEIIAMGMDGISKRVHPDNPQINEKKLKELVSQKNRPENFVRYEEQRFKHKDGHWIWLGINKNLIFNEDGDVEAIVGTVRDITEIKSLQHKLETSLNNYKSLYENARAALFRTRISDGQLLECNEAMVKLLGYKNKTECLAKHYSTQHYADAKQREELLAILRVNGQIENFEMKARRSNGELYWMKLSAQMYPEEGYLEGTIWDITSSKILTKVENEVLEQVMQGKCNKEIAAQMQRSVRTIEEHRAHIMHKLGAANLVELTKKALNY